MDKSGILVQFIGPRGGRLSRRKFKGEEVAEIAKFLARFIGLGREESRGHDLVRCKAKDGQRVWRCRRCGVRSDPVPEHFNAFQVKCRMAVVSRDGRFPRYCGKELRPGPPGVDPPGPCCSGMRSMLLDGTVHERPSAFFIGPVRLNNCPWCGVPLDAWRGMRVPGVFPPGP